MAMVMIREKEIPRDRAMGGRMWSTRPTKPVAVAVPLGLEVPALLNTPRLRAASRIALNLSPYDTSANIILAE
jgi:hypothetical protein